MDKDQRSLYDKTGQVFDDCDHNDVSNLKNWNEYFKSLYKVRLKINFDKIKNNYLKKYI